MINEAYTFAEALDREKIFTATWANEYQMLPKGTTQIPCIRLWLADDGSVSDMETLTAEQASKLRKFVDGKSSFPAFNMSPLYRVTDPEIISELKRIESGLKVDQAVVESWCCDSNWKKAMPSQIKRNLEEVPKKLLIRLGLDEQREAHIMIKLADLCRRLCNGDINHFRESLTKCALKKLKDGEDTSLALTVLFHLGSAEKDPEEDVGMKLSVILDVKSWEPYDYPVASEQTTQKLNKSLKRAAKTVSPGESELKDALGASFINPKQKMPIVKLGRFEVKLRSMFKEHACQKRYGRVEDESYPISHKSRSLIKKALEWLAAPERRGVTWEEIDSEEVIFVYPSHLPEVHPKFASIFGNASAKNGKDNEKRFEEAARELITVLKGLPSGQKPEMMQIFTIRKVDKGRTKVEFTHNTTPERLIEAAEEWSSGCGNLPEFEFGGEAAPFPTAMMKIVNRAWRQDGEQANKEASIQHKKYYQNIELFLNIIPQSMESRLTHIITQNTAGLFQYLGKSRCKDKEQQNISEKMKKQSAWEALSILGLLLYRHNKRKENYMKELPYLLGQLLRASDELHTRYCRARQKDGDVPARLAGNSLFITAGERPFQALALLSARMNPYIAWAKQYRYQSKTEKDNESQKAVKSWEAAWLLWIFEEISNQIVPQITPQVRFGDYEKASLFIGYMASFPRKEQWETAIKDDMNAGGNGNE